MSDPARLQSLIDRWLDGAATPEEAAEVDALLRSDPGAAEAFARTGKLDAALRDLTRESAGIEQRQGLLLASTGSAVAAVDSCWARPPSPRRSCSA